MKYNNTRNEQLRAQSEIDNMRTSSEAFNAKKMANPSWRIVQKTKWMDSKQPFSYRRADESLICDRKPPNKDNDPYTGIQSSPPSKPIEGRLRYKAKEKDDWSPDAIHRRST